MADKVTPIESSGGKAPGLDAVDNLGSRLRAVRQRSGLSLREVARQLAVSASFVSQLENGKSQPSVATLYSLTQLLDISIDELFDSGAPDPAPAPGSSAPAVVTARERTGHGAMDLAATGTAGTTGTTGEVTAPEPGAEAPVSRSSMASPADAWPLDGSVPRLSVTQPGDRTRLVMDSGVIWEQLARNTGHDLDFMEIIYPPGSSSTNDDRMLRHEGYEFGYLLEGELEVTYGFDAFILKPGQGLGLDSSVPHRFKNLGTVPARGIWCVQHRRP